MFPIFFLNGADKQKINKQEPVSDKLVLTWKKDKISGVIAGVIVSILWVNTVLLI